MFNLLIWAALGSTSMCNSLLGASSVHPWCLLGASLVHPRCILAPRDLVPGLSWRSKNPTGFSFKFTTDRPRTNLSQFWVNLEHDWANLGPHWSLLEPTWNSLDQLKAKFNQLETILEPISATMKLKNPCFFCCFL